MPGATSNSGIRDNHRRGLVADFLKAKIRDGSRLSVVSAYFTIYAYEALKDHLDRIEHLDFLFGEPRFIASLDPDKTEKKAFILDGHGLHLANRLQQKRVARECAAWIREKVEIRSVRHAQLLHGKMYHIVALVDQILTAKRANMTGDISTLEHKLDAKISRLYGLTPEEIKTAEEST
jgi:hypothetical protein